MKNGEYCRKQLYLGIVPMFFFLFTNGFQIGNAEQALLMENYFIRFTLISVLF